MAAKFDHQPLLSRRAITLILLLILALAAFMRFWRLAEMPPGLYHDEAYNGLDALSLLQGKTFPQFYEGWELYQYDAHAGRPAAETRWPVFFEGNYGREPAHIYLMALSLSLFGATPFAIRAVPALFGVLAVLTTFLAARTLLGIREGGTAITPLVAAFTLAILFPAVHFSRFGLRAMLFVPVETLAVFCFWQALNGRLSPPDRSSVRRALVWFLVSGGLLGLGLYIYAAARVLPLLFAGFSLFLWGRERPLFRQIWPGLAAMAGTAFLVALPLLIFFWHYPYYFFFRIAYVSNKGKGTVDGRPWLTWLANLWRVAGGLFWQGETHLRHNLPARPYLDVSQSFFFLSGAIAFLRRPLDLRLFFLALWLLVMLLPTILSGDAPHFGRMTGAAPAIAILIGLGFESLGRRLSRRIKRPPPLIFGLLSLVLLLSAVWTGFDYFGRYAHQPQLAADFYLPEWQMGRFAAAMPPDTAVYLTPTQEELATLYFALAAPDRLQDYNGSGSALPAGVPGRPVLYLVRPWDRASLAKLQAAFPDGRPGAATGTYLSFILPAGAPRNPAAHPSQHSFAGQIQLAGWTITEENGALIVTLAWQAQEEIARDYTAFVHLLGPGSRPAAQQDRQPDGHPTGSWRPGEMVIDTYRVDLPPDLPAEIYTLTTGFYDLATLERLGEPAILETITIGE